ncbi:sigma-54 interaction domain-containing protein [Sphingomonas cavernae]|uniref:AAA family ATPase n=1 Tax=Sphingomonas cavernae TaxID=2320861 RepID=A0A418WPU9_9SPHN|nr:sigma 54-interacting transcriptional regulator [Sphingomonas cavernae]RJF93229.1 AAA family ATPase [Sphingomonas cavernae]
MAIAISDRAAEASPTLAAWMTAAGLPCAVAAINFPDRKQGPRVLHASEIAKATVQDVLIEFEDGAPVFTPSANGHPARLRFGFADMVFGHALATELVRPAYRPATGEPESARFLELAARVAASDATVLVLGETGTGKEGLSRFIHARSRRADAPFVAVNCAALPDTMLEAMLFGHQKGAFTGAAGANDGLFRAADGGTLLLDEIAELPLNLQAKLLRVLQEGEVLPVGATQTVPVNVRVIAAANRDLTVEVAEGRFRPDLYWRLNVVPMALKPLHARRLDIRAITAALFVRHAPRDKAFPWPTAAALDRLMAHGWPGNVRELENVIQRAILLHDGERIEAGDLSIERSPFGGSVPTLVPAAEEPALPAAGQMVDITRRIQQRAVREALDATGGHRGRAAERLGISERTLRYRLAEMRAVA